MRTFGQIAGVGGGPMGAPPAGLRAQPNVVPVPNTVPAGVQTGAPPRVKFFSMLVAPAVTRRPTLIAPGTPENRVVTLTPPNVAFMVFVGDADVMPANGMMLPAGVSFDIPLVGLQELWAITNAPVYLRVTGLISIVLMAEQGRPVGRIGNE